jgi:hypothetical protein
MKRTAVACCLILLLVISAVPSWPGGLGATAGAQAPGCGHCRGTAPGLASRCCCCPSGASGHCGSTGQDGRFTCRCGASLPALISPTADTAPAWLAISYMLAVVTISSKLLPSNIFHPPEFHHCQGLKAGGLPNTLRL